jgi:hypothetical protein
MREGPGDEGVRGWEGFFNTISRYGALPALLRSRVLIFIQIWVERFWPEFSGDSKNTVKRLEKKLTDLASTLRGDVRFFIDFFSFFRETLFPSNVVFYLCAFFRIFDILEINILNNEFLNPNS